MLSDSHCTKAKVCSTWKGKEYISSYLLMSGFTLCVPQEIDFCPSCPSAFHFPISSTLEALGGVTVISEDKNPLSLLFPFYSSMSNSPENWLRKVLPSSSSDMLGWARILPQLQPRTLILRTWLCKDASEILTRSLSNQWRETLFSAPFWAIVHSCTISSKYIF